MEDSKSTRLDLFDNSDHRPGSLIKRYAWHIINLVFFSSGIHISYGFKRALLRLFGSKIGKGVIIKPRVNIKYPWFLEIGDYSWIGEGVWIDNIGEVNIGANCCLSQGAMLLTGNHDFTSSKFDLQVGTITLEEGVWIGAKSIVCPGVTCHSHSILSVSSVTSKDLKAYTIYRGNPAIEVSTRTIK